MTLAKVKEQDGMMLAKVKEQDGMMLAKVKEQDHGIILANVKVPSIPTSAACCNDIQSSNYLIGLRPPKPDTSSYLQLSTTSSDCILQTQIPLVILQLSITSK